MNLDMTWSELARACGGRLVSGSPDGRVATVCTDTRTLAPGDVFWALSGARHDAHDFLGQALGAAGWIVERGKRMPRTPAPHVIEVEDALKALQALAAHHRRRFDIPVAAVAGSNGKTSTKEMLRSICAQQGAVCATRGNLNNQFGLPLSLLELLPEHRFGVFELGESHPGDVAELARITRPTVGILTNVGPAHLEFFGTLEGVFKCLAELVEHSPSQTLVAVNIDDPWLLGLEGQLGSRALAYGAPERAAVRLLPCAPDRVELLVNRHRISARLAVPGKIHQRNAAAAAAGALGMGLGPEAISRGIEAFRPVPMRFEPRVLPSGARIVIDAYNANPGSMRAGIESFLEAYAEGRRILVLGDMKELGAESPRLHRELGQWISGLPVEAIFLAGRDMAETAKAVAAAGRGPLLRHDQDARAWMEELRNEMKPGAVIYFKASRAMEFEGLIETL